MRGLKTSLLWSAVMLLAITASANAYLPIIDLGPGKAYSINDNGQIVGQSNNYACIFDSSGDGANINLGALGGNQSCAYSINNSGQIVGQAKSSGIFVYGCLFDATGGGANQNLATEVPQPLRSAPVTNGIAYSNNDNGAMVGQVKYTNSESIGYANACRFFNSPEPLGGLARPYGAIGGTQSFAYSINNSGQVVGWAKPSIGFYRACSFDTTYGGNNVDLGTLGGVSSIAYSNNDSGVIVGQADYETFLEPPFMNTISRYHACIFDSSGNGENIDLGGLAGFPDLPFTTACYVNENNQIVGWASSEWSSNPEYFYGSRAVLFDSSGAGNNMDLNSLIDPASGWILREARCINNDGWIVGSMTNTSGEYHAFLLTPEPTTLVLFVLGGVMVLRKRRA